MLRPWCPQLNINRKSKARVSFELWCEKKVWVWWDLYPRGWGRFSRARSRAAADTGKAARQNCHREWRGSWSVLTEWPWARDLYQRQSPSLFILYLFTCRAFIEHLLCSAVCDAPCPHPHGTCRLVRKVGDGHSRTTMNVCLQRGCEAGWGSHCAHGELWPHNHCSQGGLHKEVTTGLRSAGQEGLAWMKMRGNSLHAPTSMGEVAMAGGSLVLSGDRKETRMAQAERVKGCERYRREKEPGPTGHRRPC